MIPSYLLQTLGAAWLGVRYSWGGGNTGTRVTEFVGLDGLPIPGRGVDCSGFVGAMLAAAGLVQRGEVDRSAADYAALCGPLNAGPAPAGALLFWGSPAYHVAISLGGGLLLGCQGGGASTFGHDASACVKVASVYDDPRWGVVQRARGPFVDYRDVLVDYNLWRWASAGALPADSRQAVQWVIACEQAAYGGVL